MAVTLTTLESNLQTKLNATSGTTDAQEFLLLSKSVEALNPSIAVQDVIDEGTTQVAAVTSTGTTQIGLVQAEGATQVAAVQSAGAGYATQADIDASVSALVDSAPATLDTLNELAAALGDDANFSTTVTNSIATKLPLAGGTMTGDVTFNANVKALFGGSNDLQIYHDGSNSIISDQGTGDLNIQSSGSMRLQNAAGTQNYLFAADGGAVQLHYAGNVKIATTSTGAAVTGDLSVSGNVSGSYTNLHPVVTTATPASAAGGAGDVDMTKPMHHWTLAGSFNISLTNIAAGRTAMLVLDRTANNYNPSWASAVKWPDDTEPTWADYRYWIVSFTCLNGTTTLASASGYTV